MSELTEICNILVGATHCSNGAQGDILPRNNETFINTLSLDSSVKNKKEGEGGTFLHETTSEYTRIVIKVTRDGKVENYTAFYTKYTFAILSSLTKKT